MKFLRVGVTLSDLIPVKVHRPGLFDTAESARPTSAIGKLNSRLRRGTGGFGSPAPPMISNIAFQRVSRLDEF